MSFKDQMNRFFAIEDESDDGYTLEDRQYSHEEPQKEEPVRPVKKQNNQMKSTPQQNVVQFKQSPSQADIKIVEPRIYSEVQQISDLLLNGKIVLVHFHKAEDDQAQKMIDFLAGTIYAIHGDMQRVGESMFICAPASVNIDGISDSLLDRDRF